MELYSVEAKEEIKFGLMIYTQAIMVKASIKIQCFLAGYIFIVLTYGNNMNVIQKEKT